MNNLTEKEAEDFLEKEGFKIAKREIIKSKNQLSKVKIPFPWVMKVSSEKIVHKNKIGGVVTNIKNISEAEKTFENLSAIKDFQEVMIQEMIYGKELILGLKSTPEFGQVILFGKGGSKVEEEKDVSFRVLPIDKNEAEKMIKEIRFYPELKKSKINMKKLKDILIKLSKLTIKHSHIQELDINPLIVNNKEAIIVDSRISRP